MTVFPLTILLPEKRIFEGKVVSVTVTAADGGLTVLAGHAPMLALLAEGPIHIRTEWETIEAIMGRGILRVDHGGAVVMLHALTWAAEQAETPPAEDASGKDLLF